jgi:hypothetical protein
VTKLSLPFFLVCVVGPALSVACSPDAGPPPTAPRDLRVPAFTSALIEAPAILAKAESGTLGRGEEDLLVRFERLLPGFGGLYIAADGSVRVYMKPSSLPTTRVQSVLSAVYASHPNLAVRQAMSNVGAATVVPGAYSLSELIATKTGSWSTGAVFRDSLESGQTLG